MAEKFRFYDNPITREHRSFKRVKKLLAKLGIKHRLYLNRSYHIWGGAWPDRNEIAVWADEFTIQEFLSTVIHEIQHVLCYREGLYKIANTSELAETRRNYEILIRTGLKNERFVDRRAKRMMAELFPNIPYRSYYNQKWAAKWYAENMVSVWKEVLETLDSDGGRGVTRRNGKP